MNALIHTKMQLIFSAIDGMSIKLTGACLPLLFINKDHPVIVALGVAVFVSTLAYNLIRIYKELKNKNGSNK
jgi:hypothetical protein